MEGENLTELHIVNGLHPNLPWRYYPRSLSELKKALPNVSLKAFTATEIHHFETISGMSASDILDELIDAGLESLTGGGAEIFDWEVRQHIVDHRTHWEDWSRIHRLAHSKGLKTPATMLYGHIEEPRHRVDHVIRLRELQDETGGFTAFITWSYQPEHTELGGDEATGLEYLRMLALSRIVLDNFPSLQASWVTQGGKVGQLSLAFGANDMGSVMIEENVVRAAGAAYCMDEVEVVRNIENAGFTAKRRNMHYEILGDPYFRMREVPRMLELATARAEGDASRPEELNSYAARSAREKQLRSHPR